MGCFLLCSVFSWVASVLASLAWATLVRASQRGSTLSVASSTTTPGAQRIPSPTDTSPMFFIWLPNPTCALNKDTRHIVHKEVMEALGKDGVIINVGRGANVDEAALVRALQEGTIAGAGLDVFEGEPKLPCQWRMWFCRLILRLPRRSRSPTCVTTPSVTLKPLLAPVLP